MQGWPDLNQAIKVTKSDFFYFFDFESFYSYLLFTIVEMKK